MRGLHVVGLTLIVTAQVLAQPPRTVAEASEFTRTGTHADVMSFLEALDAQSDRTRLDSLGTSTEGRDIPILWIGDDTESPRAARRDGRMIALLIGNIHAGEVCGKEALQMLAAELALDDQALLDDFTIAIVPIYNADGNDKMAPDNRPGQVGPEEMGQRANGQGLDLNRDFIKMEAPETRAMAAFMREWNPEVIVDTHTTNGSAHRYHLTYAGPMHPAADQELVSYIRDSMLPAVSETLEDEAGWATFQYGNFDRAHENWYTYSAQPRYATQYRGLRHRVAILSEAYSYATYEERVLATRDFTRAILQYVADHKDEVGKLIAEAEQRAARESSPGDQVAVRTRMQRTNEDVPIRGYVMDDSGEGRPTPTDEETDHEVDVFVSFEATHTVSRPWAYVVPARYANVIENLQRHDIDVQELREDVELLVEAYRIDELRQSQREFQGHRLVRVEATPTPGTRRLEAGAFIVRTDQELGTLATLLLEPESEDGLLTWEFFGDDVAEGEEFPIWRLTEEVALLTIDARVLEEDRPDPKRVTYDVLYEGRNRPNFSGSAARGLSWIDDDHFSQRIGRTTYKVHGVTGERTELPGRDAMAEALESLPWIENGASLASRARLNADQTAGFVSFEDDLYWATMDGSEVRRLTNSAEREEMPTLSPDGTAIAYVRDNNLWIVDIATGTERALTTGGHDTLRYAKHDWVYFEELYGRSWKAFWWSPDSKRIVLFETDASMMDDFTIIDDVPDGQNIETVRYPNPGERNPQARVAVVSAAGGPLRWVDLSGYDDGAYLVSGAGFTSDGNSVWLYVQNRAQTWLDLLIAPARGGEPTRLFRERTEAWVEPSGAPRWLDDGSFLWLSERTGWKHIYHYDAEGELIRQITDGDYEVRSIARIDEEAGTIWFRGTRDSHLAQGLSRVSMEGGEPERLTRERGSHSVAISPSGEYFIDTWSSFESPTKIALRDRAGRHIRWIDTNPVHDLEDYVLGRRELVTIPGEDGAPELEAIITYPPDFDESRQYPVWFMTYAGPHAPTVSDTWSWNIAWDNMLAESGIIAFRSDPYSASGKGAQSAWTADRQLGVPELADIERAIRWITSHDWADAERVGMNGHSYGGFITSYALTHSDLFAAGIAGAPVTDWRMYDTIYTERYMDTPMENPDGYDATSVVKGAKDLHGRLLLLHGTMDDNVHMQNTIRLVDALQRSGTLDWEMFIYPGYRHGIGGPHYRPTMWDFIQRTMRVGEYSPAPPSDSLADELDGVSGP